MEEVFSCALWFDDFHEISLMEMETRPPCKNPNVWKVIFSRESLTMRAFLISEKANGMLETMSNAYESWSIGWYFKGKKFSIARVSIGLKLQKCKNGIQIGRDRIIFMLLKVVQTENNNWQMAVLSVFGWTWMALIVVTTKEKNGLPKIWKSERTNYDIACTKSFTKDFSVHYLMQYDKQSHYNYDYDLNLKFHYNLVNFRLI